MPLKIRIAVGFWLFALGMIAESATAPQYTVSLYQGSTKKTDVTAPSEALAWSQCFDQAKQLQAGTTAKVVCKAPVMSLVTVPDPPPPPPVTASVTLLWSTVTLNDNGTPYTDPFGYVIDYGTSPSAMTQSIDVNDPKATTYIVPNLTTAQTYYFCVHTRNTSNVRSVCSATVSKAL